MKLVVNAKADSAEILIQGTIGESWWDDSGMSAKQFQDELTKIPEGTKLTIGINSQGGAVGDGLAIYNAIRRRGDNVTTRIDGYALSIASIIALAGARRVSPKASVWMIHEPWSWTQGDAEDHRKAAKMLDEHALSLVSIYSERTGKTADEIRSMMRDETWMRGEDAVAKGFATELNDDEVALNALDVTRFRNVPKSLLSEQFRAAAAGDQTQAPHIEDQPTVTAAPISTDEDPSKVGTNAGITTNKRTTDNMDNNAPVQVPANTPAPVNDVLPRIEALEADIKTLRSQPVPTPIVENLGLAARNRIAECKNPDARIAMICNNWNEMINAGIHVAPGVEKITRGRKGEYEVMAANTDSAAGALTTAVLQAYFTKAQNIFAPIMVFNKEIAADPIKPRAVLEVPFITAGGTAQSNPTNFEDTTNFVATVNHVQVTPAQIVTGKHITNAEFNSGWRMAWFAEIAVGELATKLKALLNAVITTGNFTTNTKLVSSSTAFGMDEVKTLWGALKKSRTKYLILDGEYYAQLLPSSLESLNVMTGLPGWDGVFADSHWTGATASTTGFACGPNAICIGIGRPAEPPNMPGASNLAQEVLTLDNGMQVVSSTWFATAGRVGWWTIETMFGAALGDESVGNLIGSA